MQDFGKFLRFARHAQKRAYDDKNFSIFPMPSIPSVCFAPFRLPFFQLSPVVCLICLALPFCSPNFAQAETPAEDAQNILNASVAAIKNLKTIECNLRMSVWVDGFEYASLGRYEEQEVYGKSAGDFLRSLRGNINSLSDVTLAPGTDPNRMTLVCHISEDRDKSQIWQYKSVEEKKELRFIRLVPLEAALQRSKKGSEFSTIAEVYNLGGLVGTLKQISLLYEFAAAPVEEKLDGDDGVAVWRISGTVRKERHDALLKQFGGSGKKGELPADFPSDIEIHIGQDDSFPYRIRYSNRPTENSKKRLPLSEMVYFDVILNGEPIPAGNFALFSENGERPEGVFNFQDDTNTVIRSLGL